MKDREPGSLPSDPYRRTPPVIDLPQGEFTSMRPMGETTETAADSESTDAETAIEPVAATGLDGTVPHASTIAADSPAAPTPDEAIPQDETSTIVGSEPDMHAGPAPTADPVPTATAREPEPEPAKRGVGGLVAASLAGGLIGAAFAVGADIYWRQPPADYESRLSALETRPRPGPMAADPGSAGLDRRIAALETQTRTLSDGVTAARGAAEAGQRQVAELAARPTPAAENQPAPAVPGPDPAIRENLDRMSARLDAVDARLGQVAPAAALAEVRTALANLQTTSEERQRTQQAAIGAADAASAGIDRRVQAESQRVTALAAEVEKLPPALLAAGLRAVVAGQIGQNLRAGSPLGPALSAMERLGAPAPSLEPLRPYAGAAAPTPAALAAEFKPLADRITSEPQGATGSIADRLLRVADKIVTVRAVGDGSGRDVPGLVGRIQTALGRGALGDAAASWDALPEDARGLSAEWGARLKGRVAAEDAAARLGAESLAALQTPAR